MHKLLIVRHGNTFDKGDVIRRVGLKSDLPLSSSGKEQANVLGQYLNKHHRHINAIYCSELIRTKETAIIAMKNHESITIESLSWLNEIDYGVDEGKPEVEVISRVGDEALKQWEVEEKLPNGWQLDIGALKQQIKQFAGNISAKTTASTTAVITSNGIARFFPEQLMSRKDFFLTRSRKVATGSISCFIFDNGEWQCKYWGLKPE